MPDGSALYHPHTELLMRTGLRSCGFSYKRLAQSLRASQTMTQTLQDPDKESLSVEIQHSWTACPFSKGI